MKVKKRIEVKIFGRVQMVMYRDFATRKARALGIEGVVWNENDGTVSLVGEGEEQKLLLLVAKLQKGPFLSHVLQVAVAWKESTGEFNEFNIIY
ncbi:MAG: acylphosphatase [Candidatus Uhrbacteria bacterium]|nr:acylphosphatase [Candidatus Uhrbacteria bacterium]